MNRSGCEPSAQATDPATTTPAREPAKTPSRSPASPSQGTIAEYLTTVGTLDHAAQSRREGAVCASASVSSNSVVWVVAVRAFASQSVCESAGLCVAVVSRDDGHVTAASAGFLARAKAARRVPWIRPSPSRQCVRPPSSARLSSPRRARGTLDDVERDSLASKLDRVGMA